MSHLLEILGHSFWLGIALLFLLECLFLLLPNRWVNFRYLCAISTLIGLVVLSGFIPGFLSTYVVNEEKVDSEASVVSLKMLSEIAKPDVPLPNDPMSKETLLNVDENFTVQTATVSAVSEMNRDCMTTKPSNLNQLILDWSPWVGGFWLVGVLLMLFRLAYLYGASVKLAGQAQFVESKLIESLIEEIKSRWSRPLAFTVKCSEVIQSPAVVGFFKPILLLPVAQLTGMNEEQLKIVLAHEMAHIRRFDYLVNFFQHFIEALFFFNPFVWLMSRRIRLERELCCDLAAVEITTPQTVAETLVQFAERNAFRAVYFGGNHHSELTHRVRRLLNKEQVLNRQFGGALLTMLLVTIGLMTLGSVAGCSTAKVLSENDIHLNRLFTIKAQEGVSHLTNESVEVKGEVTLGDGFLKDRLRPGEALLAKICVADKYIEHRSYYLPVDPETLQFSGPVKGKVLHGSMQSEFGESETVEPIDGLLTLELKPKAPLKFQIQNEAGEPLSGRIGFFSRGYTPMLHEIWSSMVWQPFTDGEVALPAYLKGRKLFVTASGYKLFTFSSKKIPTEPVILKPSINTFRLATQSPLPLTAENFSYFPERCGILDAMGDYRWPVLVEKTEKGWALKNLPESGWLLVNVPGYYSEMFSLAEGKGLLKLTSRANRSLKLEPIYDVGGLMIWEQSATTKPRFFTAISKADSDWQPIFDGSELRVMTQFSLNTVFDGNSRALLAQEKLEVSGNFPIGEKGHRIVEIKFQVGDEIASLDDRMITTVYLPNQKPGTEMLPVRDGRLRAKLPIGAKVKIGALLDSYERVGEEFTVEPGELAQMVIIHLKSAGLVLGDWTDTKPLNGYSFTESGKNYLSVSGDGDRFMVTGLPLAKQFLVLNHKKQFFVSSDFTLTEAEPAIKCPVQFLAPQDMTLHITTKSGKLLNWERVSLSFFRKGDPRQTIIISEHLMRTEAGAYVIPAFSSNIPLVCRINMTLRGQDQNYEFEVAAGGGKDYKLEITPDRIIRGKVSGPSNPKKVSGLKLTFKPSKFSRSVVDVYTDSEGAFEFYPSNRLLSDYQFLECRDADGETVELWLGDLRISDDHLEYDFIMP